MSRKFYAVAIGRETGVFQTWEEANEQVLGYSNATHKSFSFRAEAEEFVRLHAQDTDSQPRTLPKTVRQGKISSAAQRRIKLKDSESRKSCGYVKDSLQGEKSRQTQKEPRGEQIDASAQSHLEPLETSFIELTISTSDPNPKLAKFVVSKVDETVE